MTPKTKRKDSIQVLYAILPVESNRRALKKKFWWFLQIDEGGKKIKSFFSNSESTCREFLRYMMETHLRNPFLVQKNSRKEKEEPFCSLKFNLEIQWFWWKKKDFFSKSHILQENPLRSKFWNRNQHYIQESSIK